MEKYFVIDLYNLTAIGIGSTVNQAMEDIAMQTGTDYADLNFDEITVIKGKEIQIKKVVQFEEI